jgi:hypothetical protein
MITHLCPRQTTGREAAIGLCDELCAWLGSGRFAKRPTKLLNERASGCQIREAPAKISLGVPCYRASVPRLNAPRLMKADYPTVQTHIHWLTRYGEFNYVAKLALSRRRFAIMRHSQAPSIGPVFYSARVQQPTSMKPIVTM